MIETKIQPRNMVKVLRNPHLWIIVLLTVLLSIIYYGEYFNISNWFPFAKDFFTTGYPHDLHRALFFAPMLYTAIIFRLRGSVIASLVICCILIPYSIVLSPNRDPLLRTVIFIAAASIATSMLGFAQDQRIRVKRERSFASALVEGSDDAIINETIDGIITTWNPGAERMYGYSANEVIGKHVSILAPPDYADEIYGILERLKRGEHVDHFETKRLTKDGRQIYVSLTISSTRDVNGRIDGFSIIGRDITEHKQAEDNIRTYAELVTEAQEEERKRIARELHDDTAQELASLALNMDILINKPEGLSKEIIDSLEEFRERTVNIQRGIRRFSQDLRPSLLNDFGLLVALRWIAEDMTSHYVLDTSVEVSGTSRRLSQNTELVLFRIAQEALSNVRKHANANKAVIQLTFSSGKTRMVIIDDGQGFKIPKATSDFVPMGKLGILGMHERVRLINATIEIKSEIGKGTTIAVEVKE